jgi:hypothetical protein
MDQGRAPLSGALHVDGLVRSSSPDIGGKLECLRSVFCRWHFAVAGLDAETRFAYFARELTVPEIPQDSLQVQGNQAFFQ